MTISPITANEIINSILQNQSTVSVAESDDSFIPFADMLSDAVSSVYETDVAVKRDALKIAAGDADALHTLTINMAKADLAIQTLVQVRNKALDAYKEIMNITL
ncbi:MAG: flagellar hook-basal body complex protein FliE [Eubacteriales bacterium]|nr:flagellar hook-basal body complex protein FliE [Eubacteriales bacterium]MDD4422938.1 flagellar hook-basal body complex protein FliE [Eubacteriales bacterium]